MLVASEQNQVQSCGSLLLLFCLCILPGVYLKHFELVANISESAHFTSKISHFWLLWPKQKALTTPSPSGLHGHRVQVAGSRFFSLLQSLTISAAISAACQHGGQEWNHCCDLFHLEPVSYG